MNKVLLTLHLLAAIIAIGPVAVAASMFPAATRQAFADGEADGNLTVLSSLHRICRVYALVGIAVPVFGFGLAGTMHVMGRLWVIISIVLTAVAAVLLIVLILPRQQRVLTERDRGPAAHLAMVTGIFNLLWVAVAVLMVVRP